MRQKARQDERADLRPKRIQLRRTKGWRKPEGAIVVSRPSKWGNPFTVARYRAEEWRHLNGDPLEVTPVIARSWAVRDFRNQLLEGHLHAYPTVDEIRAELAGHDLACWCDLSQPCHADVLLDIANRGAPLDASLGLVTEKDLQR